MIQSSIQTSSYHSVTYTESYLFLMTSFIFLLKNIDSFAYYFFI